VQVCVLPGAQFKKVESQCSTTTLKSGIIEIMERITGILSHSYVEHTALQWRWSPPVLDCVAIHAILRATHPSNELIISNV